VTSSASTGKLTAAGNNGGKEDADVQLRRVHSFESDEK
jgi:hypothetical protein